MKKSLFLFCTFVALMSSPQLCAQYVMPFGVTWATQYAGNKYFIVDLYNNYFFDRVAEKSDTWLNLWDIIDSVNGKELTTSTDASKLLQEQKELLKLFQEKEEIELGLIRKENGEYKKYKCTIRQKNNTQGYGDLISNIRNSIERRKAEGFDQSPEGLRVISQPFSFLDCKTYDILITGNDPLVDEQILRRFCNSGLFRQMRRDEDNPDVIVCIAKSSNESISATYVPPTTSVVNTGSTTRPVYNYITRTVSYETRQHNRYVHTDGYTQTTTATNINLEFTVLDAKKMNDPKQKTAPIIWQMNYTRNVSNRNFELIDEYLAVASWNCFPFTEPKLTEQYTFFMVGAKMSNGYKDGDGYTEITTNVVPGSNADKIGLRKGDRIIRVNGKKKYVTENITHYWYPEAYYRYKDGKEREKEKNSCSYIASEASHLIYWIEYARHDHEYYRAKGYTMRYNYNSPLENRYTQYTVLRDGQEILLKGKLLEEHEPFRSPELCTRVAFCDIMAASY